MSDAQDISEAFDEDKVDDDDDYTGDDVGDDLPNYPPDRPMGVNTVGVTAIEEDGGESFAERTWREEPDVDERIDDTSVGQLVDPDVSSRDTEPQQIADEAGGELLSAEELAMHVEDDA